ncbi:MAG: head GIN domain-containing protein [Saprospiraceae bacterium]
MKSLTLTMVLTALITLSSCWDDIRCTNADGFIETRTIQLDAIEGIDLSINANVFISEGTTQEITVEGKSDAIEKLKMDVRNGIWTIEFDQCVINHDLTINITLPKLTYAKISGSGDIFGETPFDSSNDLVEFKISGSGYINLEMNAADIETSISGSGDIRLAGEATNHTLKVSGSGNLSGYDLEAVNQIITISGSGNTEIFVDGGTLEAKISGSGKVYYKGNPSSFSADVTGSGSVIDAN